MTPNDQQHPHGERKDGYGDMVENAMEMASNFGDKKEKKNEAHCQTCHIRTQNANKMATTAAVFSVGAFLLSIASVVLPFLRNTDVTFDAAAWAEFLSTLEERAQQDEVPVPEASVPSSVRLPLRPRTVPRSKPSVASSSTAPASAAPATSSAPAPSSTAPASQPAEPPRSSAAPASAAPPADAGTPNGTPSLPADDGTTAPVKPPVLPEGTAPADSGAIS